MTDAEKSEDGWIEHGGKWIPVGFDDVVIRKYRDGLVGAAMSTRDAGTPELWTHREWYDDIIAYRVVNP